MLFELAGQRRDTDGALCQRSLLADLKFQKVLGFSETDPQSVGHGPLGMIDYQNLDWSSGRLKLQPSLLLKRRKN